MLNYLWGGKKDKPENENAELAMREALDEHADFKIEEDGTMGFDDYVVLRAVIARQTLRHDFAAKENFKKKSIELFKINPTATGYAQNFGEMQKSMGLAGKMMTEKACEWIDFEFKNFMLTSKKISEDKDKNEKIASKIQGVKKAYGLETYKFKQSMADAMNAFKFKINAENDVFKKIMLQKYISPPEVV